MLPCPLRSDFFRRNIRSKVPMQVIAAECCKEYKAQQPGINTIGLKQLQGLVNHGYCATGNKNTAENKKIKYPAKHALTKVAGDC